MSLSQHFSGQTPPPIIGFVIIENYDRKGGFGGKEESSQEYSSVRKSLPGGDSWKGEDITEREVYV